jgi:hypothetical protein
MISASSASPHVAGGIGVFGSRLRLGFVIARTPGGAGQFQLEISC